MQHPVELAWLACVEFCMASKPSDSMGEICSASRTSISMCGAKCSSDSSPVCLLPLIIKNKNKKKTKAKTDNNDSRAKQTSAWASQRLKRNDLPWKQKHTWVQCESGMTRSNRTELGSQRRRRPLEGREGTTPRCTCISGRGVRRFIIILSLH